MSSLQPYVERFAAIDCRAHVTDDGRGMFVRYRLGEDGDAFGFSGDSPITQLIETPAEAEHALTFIPAERERRAESRARARREYMEAIGGRNEHSYWCEDEDCPLSQEEA